MPINIKKLSLYSGTGVLAMVGLFLVLLGTYYTPLLDPGPINKEIYSSKLIPSIHEVSIENPQVKTISIVGSEKISIVTAVTIIFENGNQKRLYALEGSLNPQETKSVVFAAKEGNRLISLKIKSFSPALIGPRGRISINTKGLSTKTL